MSRDELAKLVDAWLSAESAAVEAELEIAAMDQAAADPNVAERLKRATELRAEADRLLRLIPKQ